MKRLVLPATGSESFNHTLRQVAGKGSTHAEKSGLEVLILDEAHRLREKSVNRYPPKALRERARPQIEELLDAARVPVLLLDQFRVVRPAEMGARLTSLLNRGRGAATPGASMPAATARSALPGTAVLPR